MKIRIGWLAIGLFAAAMCTVAKADSVILRDGRHVHGKFSGGTQGVIAFAVGGTTQYYDVRSVLAMTFGDDEENPGTPDQEQVVPILPNSGYLHPNRVTPPKQGPITAIGAKYVPRKAQVAARPLTQ